MPEGLAASASARGVGIIQMLGWTTAAGAWSAGRSGVCHHSSADGGWLSATVANWTSGWAEPAATPGSNARVANAVISAISPASSGKGAEGGVTQLALLLVTVIW